MPVGTTTVSFGAPPGQSCVTVEVLNQVGITSDSYVECFIQASDVSADHNKDEHALIALYASVQPININPSNNSFTIQVLTELRLTGDVKIRWVWFGPNN